MPSSLFFSFPAIILIGACFSPTLTNADWTPINICASGLSARALRERRKSSIFKYDPKHSAQNIPLFLQNAKEREEKKEG